MGLLAATDDDGGELPIAAERADQVGLALGVGEAIASIALTELVQVQRADRAGMGQCHGMPREGPTMPSEETRDRRAWPARLLLGSWGQKKVRVGAPHPQYVTT